MSNTVLLEEKSSDPWVRELGRRAVRILNDRSIDRVQRKDLIRKLQARLLEHQAQVARKARQQTPKTPRRDAARGRQAGDAAADTSQVLARRREFQVVAPEPAKQTAAAPGRGAPAAAHDSAGAGRRRPVLKLQRA